MAAVDLVLENAKIVDGTGSSWFRGAVGVTDGTIQSVERGTQHRLTGERTVDVDDAVVCPGFIDTHSHSDLRLFDQPSLAPKTRQGITTEVLGQDGYSMAPMYVEGGAAEWEDHLSGLDGRCEREWTWGSTTEYFDAIEESGVASNIGMLVGHGTVRYNVLGMDDIEPTDEAYEEMGDLVTEALDAGALGLSTGLVYSPQVHATTEELRRLAERLQPYGHPFVAHIRSERRWLWEAFDEFVDIGAEIGVPLHASHFKVGKPQDGKASRLLEHLESARERGVDITADQYPYNAGSTLLSAVLPPWVHNEGPEQALEYMQDAEARKRMHRDVEDWRIDGWDNQGKLAGWDNVVVTGVASEANTDIEGKSVAELAEEWNCYPIEAVCDLLVDEELEVNMLHVYQTMSDVETILQSQRVNVATDGLFGGKPHPRTYGSYPRILGKYVREENLLSLEGAIRKMTAQPARAIGLAKKGLIRPGMDADLVVFDPYVIGSPATYEQPKQFPEGIPHVVVNGEFVVRDGEVTGETPGRVIQQ